MFKSIRAADIGVDALLPGAAVIGHSWCRPSNPQCGDCLMNDLCLRGRHRAGTGAT